MKKITSPARREFSFPVPIDLQRDGGDKQNSDENDNGPPALHIVNLIADRECSKSASKTKMSLRCSVRCLSGKSHANLTMNALRTARTTAIQSARATQRFGPA